MPIGWIDVVDTAVKIGLGALISGLASHYSNKYNHSKSIESEKRNLVREMLLSAVENADRYFFFLHEYYSRFDGIKHLKAKYGDAPYFFIKVKEYLSESERELAAARNSMHTAQSNLLLLGNVGASTALTKVRSLESGLRVWYLELPESEKLPDNIILSQWKSDFLKIKKDFRESTADAFQEKCL